MLVPKHVVLSFTRKKWVIAVGGLGLLLLLSVLLVPIPSLRQDFSEVLYDRHGRLLAASISEDEQWRFPIQDTLPVALEKAIVEFEDGYFYYHLGVNPVSIAKALWANIRAGKTVRGGSTITMQIMRMYRGNRSRTIPQKIIEMLGALKLELRYSKKEILKIWATIAPFGGNTVGAQTAARRYYERDLDELSWAEYATLAVLPNSPASVHLGKNIEALKGKRDFLLKKLHEAGHIDATTWQLARSEELPSYQVAIDQKAFHVLEYMKKRYPKQSQFSSTIDGALQHVTQHIIDQYAAVYAHDGIYNAAAIIIDNTSDELLAYVGNARTADKHIRYVDCAQGKRSYGSLLKPFLYAYSIDQGYFMPEEIVKDIPTNLKGFIPKNFDRKFRGAVPLSHMVSQSLNVPAVRVFNYVGMESFHQHVREELAVHDIDRQASHHGLSLILGGAESTLWDMARLYKGLVQNLDQKRNPYGDVNVLRQATKKEGQAFRYHPISVWYTLEAMMSVNRPREEQHFEKIGGQRVAWKTGTSYGHRDAWSIGCTPRYTVAVWVGNEDGEGRYDLIGVKKAAPILFRLFRELEGSPDFVKPAVESASTTVCTESGLLASSYCKHQEEILLPQVSHRLRNCSYHEALAGRDTVFVLDPAMAYYKNTFHGVPVSSASPSLKKDIRIIYPESQAMIKVPKTLEGKYSSVIARCHASYEDAELFWYLDDRFLGKTTEVHEFPLALDIGRHTLYTTDSHGNDMRVVFEVVE